MLPIPIRIPHAGTVFANRLIKQPVDQTRAPRMRHRILLSATEDWPNATHYADGFSAAGCEVAAFAPRSAPAHASGFVAKSLFYRPLAPVQSLRAAIEAARPDLIVSCDERALITLLKLYDLGKERPTSYASLIERSLGVPENYHGILSRSAGLAAMTEAGVRVPLTLPVDGEDKLDVCIREVGLPAVLKADETCGGQGVAIVRTLPEAHRAYRALVSPTRVRNVARFVRNRNMHFLLDAVAPATRRISVQRFVEGRVAASAFAADKGKIVAGFSYDVLDAQKGGLGPPTTIRRIDCPEMDAATCAVAARFGLTGAHGLDFIRDSAGAAHLIEINPRATRGGTLPFGFGRDIPHGLASMLGAHPSGIRSPLQSDLVDFSASSSPARSSSTTGWAIPRLSAPGAG